MLAAPPRAPTATPSRLHEQGDGGGGDDEEGEAEEDEGLGERVG